MKAKRYQRLRYNQSQLPEIRKHFSVVVNTEYHWTVTLNEWGALPVQFYPSTGKWVDYDLKTHKGPLAQMLNFTRTHKAKEMK